MPESAPRHPALLALLWSILGAWLGLMLYFGAAVAPAAFRVLPSPEVAGDLVGQILGPVQLFGAAAGLVLAALGIALGSGRLATGLPLLLAVLCLLNHFGVSPAVAEIQFSDLQPGDAERFSRLHQLSVGIFSVVGVGLLVLVGLHAGRALPTGRRETRMKSP